MTGVIKITEMAIISTAKKRNSSATISQKEERRIENKLKKKKLSKPWKRDTILNTYCSWCQCSLTADATRLKSREKNANLCRAATAMQVSLALHLV